MRIIISPAKKMITDTDSLPCRDLPAFLPQAEQLLSALQAMDYDALKKLWKCSDKLAALNFERLLTMQLRQSLTPAVLAYEGIQYQYMAPGVFSDGEYAYVQQHLRILSGLYGLLRPFDGVTPYRLEMQAALSVNGARDLYEFWSDSPAKALLAETDCILNLASKEYSLCVTRHLPGNAHFITCVFGEEKNGKIIEKGTKCKMARGEMVRYMSEHQITKPGDIRDFDRLDYVFESERSDESTYVFVKRGKVP